MRYHYYKALARYSFKDLHDLNAGFGVERSSRLVGQYYFGIVDKGARYCDALHLSSRKLAGLFVKLRAESHLAQSLFGSLFSFGFFYSRKTQRQLNILQNALMRYKIIALENKSDRMVPVSVPVTVLKILSRTSPYL